jgi:NRPS condensation-like uncharacterized protein
VSREIPRRLPAVTQDRLLFVCRPILDHQFHFILYFGERINEKRLGQALRLAMDAEPIFGCRYVPSRPPRWEWRDDLDNLTLFEIVPSADAEEKLMQFTGRPCDPTTDPLLQVLIVRGATDTMYLKLSHLVVDGVGGKELLAIIANLYRNLAINPAYRLPPNLGSRSLLQLFRQFGVWKCLSVFRPGAPKVAENTWKFPSTNREDGSAIRFALSEVHPARFDALRAYAKQHAVTLNDIFVTALFRTFFRYLESPTSAPQTIQVPMNLRRYLPSGRTEAACNFIAQLRVSLAQIPNEPFEGTLVRLKKQMLDEDQRKDWALLWSLTLALVCRLALPAFKRKMETASVRTMARGRTMVFFTNIGSFEDGDMNFGVPVDNVIVLPPAAPAPGFTVQAVSFRKQLTFAVCYPSRAVKREDVEEFLDRFVRELSAASVEPMARVDSRFTAV